MIEAGSLGTEDRVELIDGDSSRASRAAFPDVTLEVRSLF